MLGMEDHGIMTAWLILNYGGAGQGFGGYALDEPYNKRGKFVGRRGTARGMDHIMKIMETVGVVNWEDLPGKHIRVRSDHRIIREIGHITDDRWFRPENDD